jgi:DNA-binding response OmpR family regulator
MEYKILVVDDEENMLMLLKRVLGKAGYEVICADGGNMALRLLSEVRFDLAIIDVSMPEIDGVEVLRRLQDIAEPPPVIMISAITAWEKEQAARRLGCVDYLSKPLDMEHFKSVIKKHVSKNKKN